MTHDELLSQIDDLAVHDSGYGAISEALRAVVELHKPEQGVIESWFKWLNGTKIIGCRLCEELYPCPTIQAIEKELG